MSLAENFSQLENLEYLNIGAFDLPKLPENLGNLKQLKEIGITSHNLKEIPVSFSQLENLEKINIRCPKVDEMKSNFFDLPKLKQVHLSVGEVIEWPSFNIPLDSLFFLHISSSARGLPQNFKYLPRLKNLLVSSLSPTLPEDISAAVSLEQMYLYMPCLERLPSTMNSLPKLEWMQLASNCIKYDSEMEGFPALKQLRIYAQNETSIPSFILETNTLEGLGIWIDEKRLAPEQFCSMNQCEMIGINTKRKIEAPQCIAANEKIRIGKSRRFASFEWRAFPKFLKKYTDKTYFPFPMIKY